MNIRSLRVQLVLWNALTLTVLLAALGLVTRFVAGDAILTSVDQQLTERVKPPPHGPPRHGPHEDGPHANGPHADGPPGGFHPPPGDEQSLRFFDRSGQPRWPGGPAAWDPAALTAARRGQMFFTTVTAGGQAVRVLTHSTPPNGYVQAAYPLTEVNRTIAGLDHALLLLIPVALLAAGLGGAGLTARVLRPVKQMTQAAAAMGDAPAARLPAQGEDEFAQMAATFNGLLGRLDASFQRQSQILDQQRRFTADASHELKSPLTVILGTANQISYGGLSEPEVCAAAAEIAAAAAGMARLVQDLLLLARSDEGRLGQNKIRVPVREVLAQAIARTVRHGSPVVLEAAGHLCFYGSEDELIRVFANLLQNAAQATPPDGKITIAARQEGAEIVAVVTDTGSGVAPEHLPHLGERFYRTDTARTRRDGGTGLGLAICRSIAEAHGGTLAFSSIPGAGTTATVTLPA